jgi:GH15 family glucan-1,4-alpha-glucosidase
MIQLPQNSSLDLAVVGNCQVSGLLDRLGRLVWACLPRPDSDPAFCALLDGSGTENERGVFAVTVNNCIAHTQQYRRNTAIVETTLTDEAGNQVRLTDFCPRFRDRNRVFRPMMFVRIAEPLSGRPRVHLKFLPACDYGARKPATTLGSNHIQFKGTDTAARLTTDASITSLVEEHSVILDRPLAFLIGPDEPVAEAPLQLARAFLERTEEYWQEWVRSLAVPVDWQDAVIRAAITLKLCTFEDTGAVLAALTTSIPEAAGTGRNWDYRYCWLRDSFFVIRVLNRLGATRTMEGFLRYINNIVEQTSGVGLQPLYSLAGSSHIEESLIASLPGYRNMGPVRVGNLAAQQKQHDVYGSVVLAASQFFYDARLITPGDASTLARLEPLGDQAAALFEVPDAGPWEFRGYEQIHTFSAVMCWAACDRLCRIATHLGLDERARHWHTRATEIRERVLARSWNSQKQAFVSAFEGTELDATALLLADVGFIEASDPRFVSTVNAIDRELRNGDLLFRYRHVDDFGVPANAFTVCSFWWVNALASVGRMQEAREIFERLLKRSNHLGLFSEHVDPLTGEHWGNFPQTYSMVGVISSALLLSRSWEEVV